MKPPKPETTDEMLNQLWYAVIGANSEGIAERVRRIDERLIEVERSTPYFMTHEQHNDYVQGCEDTADKERRKRWRRTDVILSVGMLIVTAVSILGVFL